MPDASRVDSAALLRYTFPPETMNATSRTAPIPGPRTIGIIGLLGALCLLLPSVGCQTDRPAATLKLTSTADGRAFEQVFRAARFTRGATGDVDVVLIDQTEGLSRTLTGRDKPLESTPSAPLTHLMHVRVLWKPTRAIRAGSASASNATVQWVVLSRDGGRVDYTGTGFVQIDGGREDEQIRVRMRGVRLHPAHKTGDLDDPIGPVKLDATFRAAREDGTVATALAMIRDHGNAAADAAPGAAPPPSPTPAAAYDGPPARSSGP